MKRFLTLDQLAQLCLVVFGIAIGSGTIVDNSMFLHLRTGLSMAHHFAVPHADPYSFTAAGDSWVVQSWLPELSYGLLGRLDNRFRLLVVEQMVLLGLIFFVAAKLIRTGSFRRTAVSAVVIGAVIGPWISPRPLLFGLLCFAIMIWLIVARCKPWLFVPLMWIWGNSHGSWPLGLAWLGAYVVARFFEITRSDRVGLKGDLRYGAFAVVGTLSMAISPLGFHALTFPFTVFSRRDIFKNIIEWSSPDWSGNALYTLAALLVVILIVTRFRPKFTYLVPSLLFLGLGLVSLRNLAFFGISLAPLLTSAWQVHIREVEQKASESGEIKARAESTRLNLVATLVLILIGFGFLARVWQASVGIEDVAYPVGPYSYLAAHDLVGGDHRVFAEDWVGCWAILRFGDDANVFIDDRYDMYPRDVITDYIEMRLGDERTRELLQSYEFGAVVTKKSSILATFLAVWPEWKSVPSEQWRASEPDASLNAQGESRWVLYVPR